jgi:hypothetical protein
VDSHIVLECLFYGELTHSWESCPHDLRGVLEAPPPSTRTTLVTGFQHDFEGGKHFNHSGVGCYWTSLNTGQGSHQKPEAHSNLSNTCRNQGVSLAHSGLMHLVLVASPCRLFDSISGFSPSQRMPVSASARLSPEGQNHPGQEPGEKAS